MTAATSALTRPRRDTIHDSGVAAGIPAGEGTTAPRRAPSAHAAGLVALHNRGLIVLMWTFSGPP